MPGFITRDTLAQHRPLIIDLWGDQATVVPVITQKYGAMLSDQGSASR